MNMLLDRHRFESNVKHLNFILQVELSCHSWVTGRLGAWAEATEASSWLTPFPSPVQNKSFWISRFSFRDKSNASSSLQVANYWPHCYIWLPLIQESEDLYSFTVGRAITHFWLIFFICENNVWITWYDHTVHLWDSMVLRKEFYYEVFKSLKVGDHFIKINA